MVPNPKTLCLLLCILFSVDAVAQQLDSIGKQKPFAINGSIGASANFYSSNESFQSRPPFAWNLYGNLNPTIYSISLPVTFIINQFGKSYSSPFTQFGISPTYKWMKLHLGYRNIALSPLTFEGQSFKGVGLELTPGKLRMAAFYGNLNTAVNEDTSSGRFKLPQFSRKGMGAKIGIGSSNNYFDLIAFHAKDDSASAKVITSIQPLKPQENTVAGTSFKITLFKKLSFTTDIAGSVLNEDTRFEKINTDSNESKALAFAGKYVTVNNSSIFSFAGQSVIQLSLNNFNTRFGYRRVEPDFKTLGTPYMLNDIQQLTTNTNISFYKGKLNLNLNGASQRNNLREDLNSELHNNSANVAINAMLGKSLNTGINFSGIFLKQEDGIARVNDSVRLDQEIYNISFYPNYSFGEGNISNSISANLNSNILEDNNPVTAAFTKIKSLSANSMYSRQNSKSGIGYNLNLLYNRFEQTTNTFSSIGGTLGGSAQLLKEKNLNIQASVGFQKNTYSVGEASSNIIYNGNISYRHKKHAFNAFVNYVRTPPTIVINPIPTVVASDNFYGGLSYNYSF
jgi:hypothetical protein